MNSRLFSRTVSPAGDVIRAQRKTLIRVLGKLRAVADRIDTTIAPGLYGTLQDAIQVLADGEHKLLAAQTSIEDLRKNPEKPS